jgi:5-oxoprolinase (ATP-hydrolysing)
MTPQQVALGFIRVANEAMCRPIRVLTQAKGHNTTTHTLACFGGAGGQHACAIARNLGMTKIKAHRYSGILSAYGLAAADVVHEEQVPSAMVLAIDNYYEIWGEVDKLIHTAIGKLEQQGFDRSTIVVEPFLNLRYAMAQCASILHPIYLSLSP